MKTFNRQQLEQYLQEGTSCIIAGPVGVGKTTLIRKPRMSSAHEIAAEYQLNGIEAVKAIINNQIAYQDLTVIIDDIGLEQDVKHFGNGLDPIAFIIQKIYDINQTAEKKIRLLLTTNLNKTELTEKYGERVISRLWEMCEPIVLQDTSFR